MANVQHSTLGNQGTKSHGIIKDTVANAAALALYNVSANDVAQKIVIRQLDTDQLWTPVTTGIGATFTPLGAVSSVFNRTGAVVGAAGDYVASQVGNNSSVPGSFVSDALDAVQDMENVAVATTGNVALTGTPANIDTGVTLVSGTTLILVWLQTNPNENGVYLYNSGGAWTRANRWNTVAEFRTAQPFEILGGTLYGGRLAWVKLAPTTIGSSSIIFNTALDIAQPTADGQTLQYRASNNQMQAAGIKTYQLSDADEAIDLTKGSCFQLNVQLTSARTLTLGNTGATDSRSATFDIRVALAFTLTVVNALTQNVRTFPAGSKWFGCAIFTGQWLGGPYQEAV